MSECGLVEGQKPGEAFTAGQVVKARVLGSDPSRKRLKLSLTSKSRKVAAAAADGGAEGAGTPAGKEQRGDEAAAVALGGYQPGDLVHGTVAAVHLRSEEEGEEGGRGGRSYVEVALAPTAGGSPTTGSAGGAALGRLELAHLADHPAAAAALAAALAPGARLGPLLVLQRLEGARQLRLTRKTSLLEGAAAGLLPRSMADVAEGAVLPGYVASVTADAVFVQ